MSFRLTAAAKSLLAERIAPDHLVGEIRYSGDDGQLVESFDDCECCLDVAAVEGGDARVRTRFRFHESGVDQPCERFADWSSAQSQILGEFAVLDLRARRQFTGDDRFANAFESDVAHSCSLNRFTATQHTGYRTLQPPCCRSARNDHRRVSPGIRNPPEQSAGENCCRIDDLTGCGVGGQSERNLGAPGHDDLRARFDEKISGPDELVGGLVSDVAALDCSDRRHHQFVLDRRSGHQDVDRVFRQPLLIQPGADRPPWWPIVRRM